MRREKQEGFRTDVGWLAGSLRHLCSLPNARCVFTSMWPRLCMKKKSWEQQKSKQACVANPAESWSLVFRGKAVSNTKGVFRIKLPLCLMLWNMHDLHGHSKPPHLSKNKKMCLFFPYTDLWRNSHSHITTDGFNIMSYACWEMPLFNTNSLKTIT